MSVKEKIELIEVINSLQNENNLFINISEEDLEKVYNYVKKHDLNLEETITLLKDLAYV